MTSRISINRLTTSYLLSLISIVLLICASFAGRLYFARGQVPSMVLYIVEPFLLLLQLCTLAAVSLLLFRPLLQRLRSETQQLEMLSVVASRTDNAVVITDALGMIEWVNDGFTRMSGYTLAEVSGRRPGEFLQGPETDPATVDAIRWALRRGESVSAEIINYHKNGQTYWLSLTITPVHDQNGTLRRFVAVESDITARKDLEQSLRSALKDAADLTYAINQAAIVAVTDQYGRILDVNDRFCAIAGYNRDELIGQDHRIVNSGQHPRAYMRDLWRTIAAGKVWHGEICNQAKSGKRYWVDSTIVPFLNEKGLPEQYFAIRFDITERKQAEVALRDSEERYRSLVAALSEGIVLQSADGSIQTCNASAEQILGLTADQLMGRTCTDPRWRALHEDGTPFPGSEHPAMVTLRTGLPQHNIVMGVHKPDDSLTWISINAQPIVRPGENSPHAVVTSFFDITLQRRAEQKLRFSEQRFRTLATHAPVGIFQTNAAGTCTFVNETWTELTGIAAADGLGDGWMRALHPADADHVIKAWYETLGSQQAFMHEYRYLQPNGGTVWVLGAAIAMHDGDGSITGYLGTVTDITERKAVERMKNEFVSTVSHELRTPLTSIRGALGLIAGGVVGELPPQVQSMVQIALKNSERLVRLINDILDSEKIDSGAMVFELAPLALVPLVEQVLEDNRAYGAQFGVTFVLEQPAPEVWVSADADRLIQVVTNLLSNAAKFSPPNELVTITIARAEGQRVRLSVHDDGPGISESFRSQIFQKFAQADSSNTRQQGGTGLGLSISKSIVERHKGRISFTSEPGHGTTFCVELPEWHPLPQLPVVAPAQPPQQRILICEDDLDIATLLSLMLQQVGFATDIAADAASMRRLLASGSYVGMTLDMTLPDQDGVALIRELRVQPHTRDLPIVVVSACNDRDQDRLSGDAIGIVDWLSKPIDHSRLVKAVKQAVHTPPIDRPLRVLHVEDDCDIVDFVTLLLSETALVIAAPDVETARELLRQERFDLAILDLDLCDGSGLALLPELHRWQPPIAVLIFSAQDVGLDLPQQVTAALVKSRTSNQELLSTITALLGVK